MADNWDMPLDYFDSLPHICHDSCQCINATCKVCLDLNPTLCKRDTYSTRPYEVVTSLSSLNKSSASGCSSCSIIHIAILEFAQRNNPRFKTQSTKVHIGLVPGHRVYVEVSRDSGLQHGTFLKLDLYSDEGIPMCVFVGKSMLLTLAGCPSPWPVFGLARSMPAQLSIEDCVEFARLQLLECDSGHTKCKLTPGSFNPPTRLLDLRSSVPGQLDQIKLVQGLQILTKYVALSYCWGSTPHFCTTRDTLPAFSDGILLSCLPARFQDAVHFTRKLGIRYLWLDALCIVQDDHDEWEREASNMGQIYASAYLTIAVTHSADNTSGFLPPRTPNLFYPPLPYTTHRITGNHQGQQFSIYARPTHLVAHHDILIRTTDIFAPMRHTESPLLCRSWAFQERMLSRRVLHLHATELVWECNTFLRCECGRLEMLEYPDPSPLSLKLEFVRMIDITGEGKAQPEIWQRIVGDYCKLKLTKESDRLPALSGIASRYLEIMPTTFGKTPESGNNIERHYLAGMWRDHLSQYLLWAVSDTLQGSQRLVPPCAPTWSWASMDAPSISDVYYVLAHPVIEDPRLCVVDAYCHLAGSNRFGQVSGGLLRIEGAYIAVRFECDEGNRSLCFRDESVFFGSDVAWEGQGVEVGEMLYCLLVGREERDYGEEKCIVLQRMAALSDKYQRVGVLDLDQHYNWFEGADVRLFDVG